jgi:hypothetical protein
MIKKKIDYKNGFDKQLDKSFGTNQLILRGIRQKKPLITSGASY